MREKRKTIVTLFLISILTISMSLTVFAAVRITINGSQTMAVGTSRRIYVTGAGKRTVMVAIPKNRVLTVRKDSTSYIVTGSKAGSAYVTVTVGSIRKKIHIVTLSDAQMVERVVKRVNKSCPGCKVFDYRREGKCLVISMHLKSMGEGAIASDIKVNLQTGRAVIDLDQDFMDEWDLTIPKSFLIW